MLEARKKSAERLAWSAILLLMFSLAISGCDDKVPKPASDSSPPAIKWMVLNNTTKETTTVNGSGEVNAHLGDTFLVTLIAADPQGVHETTFSTSTNWQCTASSNLAEMRDTLGVKQTSTEQPDTQGNVSTELRMIRTVQPALSCSPGYTFDWAFVSVKGTAENYFNGITEATLTLRILE